MLGTVHYRTYTTADYLVTRVLAYTPTYILLLQFPAVSNPNIGANRLSHLSRSHHILEYARRLCVGIEI
jgi:hypothetical protein